MSYMGAIGSIMAGSGLEELWGSVYASGSISHMMNGHAYSRALRAHFLSQAALIKVIFDNRNEGAGDDISSGVSDVMSAIKQAAEQAADSDSFIC